MTRYNDLANYAEVLTHILSHLPPKSLADMALVSRQFHGLVTTPHAWRMAFARYFPGAQAITKLGLHAYVSNELPVTLTLEKRIFTRLTVYASWRNEYIIRTGLLQSLARGKPADFHGDNPGERTRPVSTHKMQAQVTYNSNLVTTINHVHASFGSMSKKHLDVIHGTDEGGFACLSDPKEGKVDRWGFADPRMFSQFVDHFPGDIQYGLGPGEVVGLPNVMSVSQPYGMVFAEGFPGGSLYYRSIEEHRGRILNSEVEVSSLEIGIPRLFELETVCSVWITKTPNIPEITGGLVGILSGSSHGTVSSYSLGTQSLIERRLERGEITCRWVLSPGVPIIAIAVDENFSVKRQKSQRIWAVVLNALGEVYYLTHLPLQPLMKRKKLDAFSLERLAWKTGRSVCWTLIEATKRSGKSDPFGESDSDGAYSPRTSWNGMCPNAEQISAETREIEAFMQRKPKFFRQVCDGWDMRRKLEVDFGSMDENEGGEGIVVVSCGVDESQVAMIKRFTRCKMIDFGNKSLRISEPVTSGDRKLGTGFDSMMIDNTNEPAWSMDGIKPSRHNSACSQHITDAITVDEWRTSVFEIGSSRSAPITTTAMDMSTFALLTIQEDPLANLNSLSGASTPSYSYPGRTNSLDSSVDFPGQRGRFIAAGTKTGMIIVWNVRDPFSKTKTVDGVIRPVRIIQTDSPEISCLALSALYLVHGGNDGLVQAWDPLASNSEPIRTLNSRFSSRARRRLIQAQGTPGGIGVNLFAAGAVYLDPDPTILRGVVSLGAHLRYWSYSSLATDQYKSIKRRLRRSGRSGNHGADRFPGTARGALKDYIANEKLDLEQDKKEKRKEGERLAGRFGLDLLGPGATEDELLAYATLLSEESAVSDEEKRKSSPSGSNQDLSDALKGKHRDNEQIPVLHEEEDADLAEAIRLSLKDSHPDAKSDFDENEDAGPTTFTVRYVKARKSSA